MMTEQEWLQCTDPKGMLELVQDKVSDRKLRLFAVACCRRIWHLMQEETRRLALEVAERYADDLAAESQRASVEGELDPAGSASEAAAYSVISVEGRPARGTSIAVLAATTAAQEGADWGDPNLAPAEERLAQAVFLRDIFGNPFATQPRINPAWLTPTLTSLAAAAYEERSLPSGQLEPTRLAVLSDALEEAGCADAGILSHLRSPGPHVRGCWALDLLLGKS